MEWQQPKQQPITVVCQGWPQPHKHKPQLRSSMRALAELEPIEVRVLGVLMEKEQTTPEYYPMTLNTIKMACNQKTNRFPVMNLREEQVQQALDHLDEDLLVVRAGGARADHWKQRADIVWKLD